MPVTPYVNFRGQCESALAQYAKALGAEFEVVMRHGDAPPEFGSGPEHAQDVMHSRLSKGGETLLLASDVGGHPLTVGDSVSLSYFEGDVAKAHAVYDALADGGTKTMPMGPVFWGGEFGMLTDRFGVNWMISTNE